MPAKAEVSFFAIEQVSSTQSLGVFIDENLNWNTKISVCNTKNF